MDATAILGPNELELLESIADNLGAGLCIISRDYRTLWANRALRAIFGDVVGKVCHTTYNQRDTICPNCGVSKLFERGQDRAVHEQVGEDKDGNEIWSEIIATPLRNEQGNVWAALELVVPITDRKRAELLLRNYSTDLEATVLERTRALAEATERLRESEELYRSLVENIDLGIALIDADHRVVMTNAGQGRLLHKRPADLVGRECFREFEGRDEVCPHCPGIGAMATGRPTIQDAKGVRDDGTTLDVRIRAFPLREGDGPCRRFIEVVEDVTERKRVERALLEREEQYRNLFEQTSEGIFVLDREGRIAEVNEAFASMHGFTVDELRGMPLSELELDQQKGLDPERSKRLLAGETLRFEATHRHKAGHTFPVAVMVNKIRFRGADHFLSFHRDVSEERKLQERMIRAEKLAAVGQLASGVAHEFNNILAIVDAYVQTMLVEHQDGLGSLPPAAVASLEAISATSQRGGTIAKEMMSFARPRPLRRERVAITTVLDHTLALQEKQLRLQGIEIVRGYASSPLVWLDAAQIQQVFLNLVINAKHAILSKGRGTITVRVRDAPDAVTVDVADDGVGMSGEVRRRIFSPFFTTKSAYAQDEHGIKGTGLGLSVAHEIVQQHGGTIDCTSVEGEGTVFTVVLPHGDGADAEVAPVGPAESPSLAVMRILVVDDEPMLAATVVRVLVARGCDAAAAESGALALERMREKPYDVVLLDLLMPDVRGHEVLARIREGWPETSVVVVSGQLDLNDAQLRRAGADAVLLKPFDFRVLFATLSRIAEARRQRARKA